MAAVSKSKLCSTFKPLGTAQSIDINNEKHLKSFFFFFPTELNFAFQRSQQTLHHLAGSLKHEHPKRRNYFCTLGSAETPQG